MWSDGAIAQLGERLPCTQEVSGSIPLGSTILDTVCCFVTTDKSDIIHVALSLFTEQSLFNNVYHADMNVLYVHT